MAGNSPVYLGQWLGPPLCHITITLSTASCERSFSKLTLIKTYQRSTMSQERLSNLAILSIERDFNIDFNTVIEKFAQIKTRLF